MNKLLVSLCALALFIGYVSVADARHSRYRTRTSYTPPPSVPTPAPKPIPVVTNETRYTTYITGYASGDNDPPNSTTIWLDGKGGNAGGTGTYSDPITLAVAEGAYPRNTIFYLPYLQKYFIAEDSCAGCSKTQLDVYVGDYSGPKSLQCENSITGNHEVIKNPNPNYSVNPGDIYKTICGY